MKNGRNGTFGCWRFLTSAPRKVKQDENADTLKHAHTPSHTPHTQTRTHRLTHTHTDTLPPHCRPCKESHTHANPTPTHTHTSAHPQRHTHGQIMCTHTHTQRERERERTLLKDTRASTNSLFHTRSAKIKTLRFLANLAGKNRNGLVQRLWPSPLRAALKHAQIQPPPPSRSTCNALIN